MARHGQASRRVRAYLKAHPETTLGQVVSHFKLKGISVSRTLVYQIRTELRNHPMTPRPSSNPALQHSNLVAAARLIRLCGSLQQAKAAVEFVWDLSRELHPQPPATPRAPSPQNDQATGPAPPHPSNPDEEDATPT